MVTLNQLCDVNKKFISYLSRCDSEPSPGLLFQVLVPQLVGALGGGPHR